MPATAFIYILEKLKRSIAGQKVMDKEDVDGALLYTAAETEDVDGNATGVVRLAGVDADGNATTQDLGTAALKTVGNAAGQIPVVEAGGKLPEAVIPGGDITADQVPDLPASKITSEVLNAARLATGQKGVGKVIVGTAAGQEWQEMQTPNRNGARLEAVVALNASSFTDVISIPITPRSNTKKIKVSIAAFVEKSPTAENVASVVIECKVLRGSTEIIGAFGNDTGFSADQSGTEPVVAFTIDSPASAAEQTYKLQCKTKSGSTIEAGIGTAIEVEEL